MVETKVEDLEILSNFRIQTFSSIVQIFGEISKSNYLLSTLFTFSFLSPLPQFSHAGRARPLARWPMSSARLTLPQATAASPYGRARSPPDSPCPAPTGHHRRPRRSFPRCHVALAFCRRRALRTAAGHTALKPYDTAPLAHSPHA